MGGGGRKGEEDREGEKEGGRVRGREQGREREREVGILLYLLVFKIARVQKGREYGLRSHVI